MYETEIEQVTCSHRRKLPVGCHLPNPEPEWIGEVAPIPLNYCFDCHKLIEE